MDVRKHRGIMILSSWTI